MNKRASKSQENSETAIISDKQQNFSLFDKKDLTEY
jgi:hypothetical protein